MLSRRPRRPLLLPPLARASLYSPTPLVILRRRQPHTTTEPVNARTPLRVGIHCRIFPGSASSPSYASPSSTAVVLSARRGQCGQRPTSIGRVLYMERLTAGSTAAARKCLLITRKIIIPPPDSGDPKDGPLYFAKKTFPPDCWDPPATPSRARKCIRAKKQNDSPPDCWDPPATSSHARKSLTVGTHLVEAYVVLSFWSRTCTYIYTGRCRGAHVS